ncbi:DUF2771 family protein [Corynebacterium sp. HMSC11E11]|uniref:DUF2771 family protein n=1 Tax=Corynebacterium TaxID=1716 RepID=UPI0008C9A811|nr:DUF2771 family protein [Corynebacterium sp. HMSC11E11]OFU53328.1 hypothetical protein HMPREF3121_09255 [Corynebacterium sp. HMSC11E11]
MATLANKKTWRIIGVIVAVALIITGLVLVLDRANDDTVEDPAALTMTVRLGDEEIEVLPYRICNMFEEGEGACTTDDDATAHVSIEPEEVAEIEVADEVASVTWAVQRFYVDEAVNSADRKEPGEAKTESVAGSASVNGERVPLGVIEVSTTVIGHDDAGEEVPYGITWSVANDADGE